MGNNRLPVLILFASVLILGGCGPHRAVLPETPHQTVSLKELRVLLEDRASKLTSIKALMIIRPKGLPSVTGSLLIARSSEDDLLHLRLKGFDRLGRTLFDSVSSGDRVRILIPDRKNIIEGRVEELDSSSLPVKPRELFGAVWAAMGPWIRPGEIPVLEQRGEIYMLQLIRIVNGEGRLVRRLWFERQRLRMVRAELFGDGIRTGVVVDFEHDPIPSGRAGEEVSWPDRISIRGLSDEFRDIDPWDVIKKVNRKADLVLEFREVQFNIEVLPEELQLP